MQSTDTFNPVKVPGEYYQPNQYLLSAGEVNHFLMIERILHELMQGGVHNWEGFDKAMERAEND